MGKVKFSFGQVEFEVPGENVAKAAGCESEM